MTRESESGRDKPEADRLEGETAVVPNGKQGRGMRKKDLSPEQANELRARQRAIGNELKRIFDDVAREPVPEEFLELLKQIDGKHEG